MDSSPDDRKLDGSQPPAAAGLSQNSPNAEPGTADQDQARAATLDLGLFAIRLGSSSRRLREAIQSCIAGTGITDLEFLLLCMVSQPTSGGWIQAEVGTGLAISPARLSTLVDGLRRRELLNVTRDERDRRKQRIELTSQGAGQVRRAVEQIGSAALACRVELDDHNGQCIFERLERISQAVDRNSDAPATPHNNRSGRAA